MHEITGRTRVFEILADLVHYVQTPQALNARMEERGFDGVLAPCHLVAADLAASSKRSAVAQSRSSPISTRRWSCATRSPWARVRLAAFSTRRKKNKPGLESLEAVLGWLGWDFVAVPSFH